MERAGSNDGVPSPMAKAISFDERLPTRAMSGGSDGSFTHGLLRRPRRLTNELGEPKRPSIQPHAGIKANRPSSVFTQDMDSDEDVEFLQLTSPNPQPLPHMVPDDEDEATDEYLSLPHESFTLEQLVKHLHDLGDGNDVMPKALGDMWDHRRELDAQNVVDEGDLDTHPTYEVYDVDHTGIAVPQHEKNDALDGVEAATVWETLKEVSSEGAVGRITILQEPSPLMLGAVHMTMAQHFDMDELFRHLITTDGNKGKTRAYVDRAFEPTETRRRTFFFVFKYFTVVGEGLKSAPWQKFDYRPPDKRSIDHIDITECSSILALSLEGQPIKKVTRNNRRQRKKAEEGYIYHPFAPWHLLSIQCFPDNAHSLRSEDLNKKFVSGPYAFLDTLAAEYRDAVKRYATLNEMITKLITPPSEFMFDVKLRDKLLFEDANFTYSRRYFWAYNSLGVINDGIKSMRAAYFDTFKDDFWQGRNRTVWPYPYQDSEGKLAYEKLMATVREDLEKAVLELDTMHKKNERTRNEIFSLREQLFSGSSVRESRRAIEQGDNIKILTGVSMLFLPLTFVTSVFGITTLDIKADDWRFPVTMVTVCVPFFVLIFVLQTRAGVGALRKSGKFLDKQVSRFFGPGDRRQLQHQYPAVVGLDGSQIYPGDDGRRRRRRKGLRRTQSGFQSMTGGVVESERRTRKWFRFPWRERKAREDSKEVDV